MRAAGLRHAEVIGTRVPVVAVPAATPATVVSTRLAFACRLTCDFSHINRIGARIRDNPVAVRQVGSHATVVSARLVLACKLTWNDFSHINRIGARIRDNPAAVRQVGSLATVVSARLAFACKLTWNDFSHINRIGARIRDNPVAVRQAGCLALVVLDLREGLLRVWPRPISSQIASKQGILRIRCGCDLHFRRDLLWGATGTSHQNTT
jgi:hypothetical protein